MHVADDPCQKHLVGCALPPRARQGWCEKYNIRGEEEVSNLDLAKIIASEVGKPLLFDLNGEVDAARARRAVRSRREQVGGARVDRPSGVREESQKGGAMDPREPQVA